MGSKRKVIHDPDLQVPIWINGNPDGDTRQEIIKILNVTLADEAVLGLKTRNASWNVSGAGFSEWHDLFDKQYKQLNEMSNDISKRTWVLGGLPLGSIEELLKNTRLTEIPGTTPDFANLISTHEALIRLLRADAEKCAETFDDAVTGDFLFKILHQHEKMVWMLRSQLDNEPNRKERQERVR
jgi:starvation-inducible DNA-binding protein